MTTGIDSVDDKLRALYFTAAGREKREDPYYTHMYRVGYDGTGIKLLNPGNASHSVVVSDSARFFVNNMSRVDGAPEAALYDTLGNMMTKLESPDLAARRSTSGSSSPSHSPSRLMTASPISRGRSAGNRFLFSIRTGNTRSSLMCTRSADRERDEDLQPGAATTSRSPSSGSSSSRSATGAAIRPGRSGITITATAISATTVWPTKKRRSRNWPNATRISTSTGSPSGATRAAVS